jgi:hypothetical protein
MPKISIYRPGSDEVELRELPGRAWDDCKDAVAALVDCEWPEHVTVLHERRRADLFVHERGAILRLPVNELATQLYWAASKARGIKDFAGFPRIHGVAVLFHTIIWR